MEQVQQQSGLPGQRYSMHRIQHPRFQQGMQVMPQPSSHQRRDSGYSQNHSSQTYGHPIHHTSQAASPIVPSQHPPNVFMTPGPSVAPPNSSMVHQSNSDSGFANLAINHIMQRYGSLFAGYESTTQSLCGKVDLVQSGLGQLESTVISLCRDIDAKLQSTRSPAVEQRATEVERIKDSSKNVGAIYACEFGHVVTIQGKADTSATDQEFQDPSNSDQHPDVLTEGQDPNPGIFHGSLRQRLDCMAKLVFTEQIGNKATTDCFNKVFEMLQSVSGHFANVATKQDLEALRAGTRQDLEMFRRTLRQDLEADRKATVQDVRTLFEEIRQDFGSFRGGEIKQEFETIHHKHDQHVSTTNHRLNECLTTQTNTLEAFRSSENRLEQEMSSVRDTLKGLIDVVTARLPVIEYQPEVVEEHPPAFSFAQLAKIDYDPSDGAAECTNMPTEGTHVLPWQGRSQQSPVPLLAAPVDPDRVYLESIPLILSEIRNMDQKILDLTLRVEQHANRATPTGMPVQATQYIAEVTQACDDTDSSLLPSSREFVGDRDKAPEIYSNEICPKTLANLLRPYMSSSSSSLGRSQEPSISPETSRAMSEEMPVQQVPERDDVRIEGRSRLHQKKRQKKQRIKHRVDIDGVFGSKQLSSRMPALVSSSGLAHGQKVQKRKWEASEIPQSRADLLQQQQQAYRKKQRK